LKWTAKYLNGEEVISSDPSKQTFVEKGMLSASSAISSGYNHLTGGSSQETPAVTPAAPASRAEAPILPESGAPRLQYDEGQPATAALSHDDDEESRFEELDEDDDESAISHEFF